MVMVKQPGHLTSMKKERGAGTRVCLFGGKEFVRGGFWDGEGGWRTGTDFEFVFAGFGGWGGV